MEFAGFDDWIEIMKAGSFIDMNGKRHTFTDQDLETIAASYNPQGHEAPIVIGHPQLDAPAFGWVDQVKADNGTLFFKARDVVPEFADMVKKGLFKKRSISLYPNKQMKHVGFLGAVPPAIKGLKNIAFSSDPQTITIELAELSSWSIDNIARVFRNIRDYLIESVGKDKADTIVPDYMISDIKPESAPAQEADQLYSEKEEHGMDKPGKGAPPQTFSEADVERIRSEGKAEGIREAEAQFAEQQKSERKKIVMVEIASFCEGLKKDGKLIPAWEKLGLKQFMESLDAETVIEFAEGETGKKSQLDFMKAFLAEIPKVVNLSEIASRDKDAGAVGTTAGEHLDAIVRKKMKDDPKLDLSAAFAEAQTENPDLAKAYQVEITGGE